MPGLPSAAMLTSSQIDELRARFFHADACPVTGPRAFFENAGGSLTLKAAVERTAELMRAVGLEV